MTHGHELREGNAGGRGCRDEVNKGEKKKRDNYSSIINKIYFKKNKRRGLLKTKWRERRRESLRHQGSIN